MLEPKKSRFIEQIFSIYNRNLIRRRFISLKVSGLQYLALNHFNLPLIIYCNHSSWWDGLIAFQISYQAHLDSFIMMDEVQLKKYPFFQKLGAFSIDRKNLRCAFSSIRFATNLFKNNPSSILWIFPQGEILPNDIRPLKFMTGIGKIISDIGDCSSIACSFRYEHLGEFKPNVFVRFSSPQIHSRFEKIDKRNLVQTLENHSTENLDELMAAIVSQNLSDYERLV